MSIGFGDFDVSCPGYEGHEWQRPGTEKRCCVNCGSIAAEFMTMATTARAELFASLRFPESANGKAQKR